MAKGRGEIENGNGDVRVKKPRMKWTDELHQSFLDAVATLGGEDCKPKLIFFFPPFSIQILRSKIHGQICF